jgi:hypothetical protein
MKQSLSQFQDAFVEALYDPEADRLTLLTEQPGFTVYRNTVMKGAVDALQANFPTVERLVGSEWFLAAAAIHAGQSPAVDARLVHHGRSFPDFLDRFEHAREMPYLGNVARLDLLWNQCHTSAEEPGIDLNRIAGLSPEQLTSLRLTPRAAARWMWFAEQPVFTIWRYNRERLAMPEALDWRGEGALLVRTGGVVTWQALAIGESAFLDACAAGAPLEQAADHASDVQPSLDILELLTRLVNADVFAATELA